MNADSKKKLSQLRKGMGMNYQHHWIVDNMPVSLVTAIMIGMFIAKKKILR